jgi:hypothetical protein
MNKKLIAQLTLTRKDGKKTIIEVQQGATFHSFYQVYIQEGRRWSTKRWVRTASRNEGLNPAIAHLQQPGLQAVANRIAVFKAVSNPIVSTKVKILKKRIYKRLLTAAPEALGMVKTSPTRIPIERFRARGIAVQLKVAERVAR